MIVDYPDDIGGWLEEARSAFAGRLFVTRSLPHYVEIGGLEGTKSKALQFLCERWGIEQERVLAFGDADNDIDMLRFAGRGVAVGGMTGEVREAADEVVPGVDEDGVARYVERLTGRILDARAARGHRYLGGRGRARGGTRGPAGRRLQARRDERSSPRSSRSGSSERRCGPRGGGARSSSSTSVSVVGLVHLVISGRVLRLPEWREPDRMNTAVLEFGGEGGPVVLAFTRLWLGYFDLYEPGEEDKHPLISRLGPDPFSDEFTVEYLTSALDRKANIKGLLLDQSVVAGLGNIYVDEVLFAAGVNPTRKANTLTSEEIEKIHAATRDILARAIELRGTTFDSYHDAFGETGKFQHQLKVFTREGEPCPRCGTQIVKIPRRRPGNLHCPSCQPA